MTLNIRHRVLPTPADAAPCVWCTKLTDIWADTPFRPDIGAVPLHLLCGVWMRDAYKAWVSDSPMAAADFATMSAALGRMAQIEP